MDPDQALVDLRSLAHQLQGNVDGREPMGDPSLTASNVVEVFDAPRDWLCRGGYPPAAWRQ